MKKPKLKKGIYQHFKNITGYNVLPSLGRHERDYSLARLLARQNKKFYEVLDVVRHTETEEWMVLYKPLYRSPFANLTVRPYKMFFEKVKSTETKKLVPRFLYIRKTK